jgi:endoglucanase
LASLFFWRYKHFNFGNSVMRLIVFFILIVCLISCGDNDKQTSKIPDQSSGAPTPPSIPAPTTPSIPAPAPIPDPSAGEKPGPLPAPTPIETPKPSPPPKPDKNPKPVPTPVPLPTPTPLPTPIPDPVPSPIDTVVGNNGFLRIDAGSLVNEKGEKIQLKGMSLFWSQWSEPFYNKEAVRVLAKDWKSTVVRAAMGIEMGGYLSNPVAQEAMVQTVVQAAIDEGIYVIIDWHDHNAQNHQGQAIEFFGRMANKYKNVPNVIFEVFNEPLNIPWVTIKNYAVPVIQEIRRQGSNAVVIIGTRTWSQEVEEPADDKIDDSNTMYALHFYAATHKAWLREKAKRAMYKGIALFVTEFGVSESSGDGYLDFAEADAWMRFMRDNNISWANWSLFDKRESSAALNPGASPTGPWPDRDISASGLYIKAKIME